MQRIQLLFLPLALLMLTIELAWPAPEARVEWRLPPMTGDDGIKQLQVRLWASSLKNSYDQLFIGKEPLTQSHENGYLEQNSGIVMPNHGSLDLIVTGSPYQSFLVCADQVEVTGARQSDTASVMAMSLADSLWQLIIPEESLCLQLRGVRHCDRALFSQHPFQFGQFLLASEPLLIEAYEPLAADRWRQICPQLKDEKPSAGGATFAGTGTPPSVSISGGYGSGFSPDNDDFRRRPPWLPMPSSQAFSLWLLPTLTMPEHLPENLLRWLPPEVTYLSEVAANSGGGFLLFSMQGLPPVSISVSRYELEDLPHRLGDWRQLLLWLLPKLNGREALVDLLLEWQDRFQLSANSYPIANQQAIEKQFAELLEQDDWQFHLDLWVNTLADAKGDTKIINLPDNPPGQTSAPNLQRQSSDSQDKQADSNRDNLPPGRDSGQGYSGEQGSRQNDPSDPVVVSDIPVSEITITLIGEQGTGKTSVANGLLHSNVLDKQCQKRTLQLGKFTIRSLPGYGEDLETDEFLEEYPIKNNELVVLVASDQLTDLDETVLNALLEQGFPPERLIFVRNYFRNALEPKLSADGLSLAEMDNPKVISNRQELEKTLQDGHLDQLKAMKLPEATHTPLVFTSAEDVNAFLGDDALIQAIQDRLSEREQLPFELFRCLRFPTDKPEIEKYLAQRLNQSYLSKISVKNWYNQLREILQITEQDETQDFFRRILPFIAQALDNQKVFRYLLIRHGLSPYSKLPFKLLGMFNSKAFKYLLTHYDISFPEEIDGEIILHLASAYGCSGVVKLLITEFNASPSAVDYKKYSLLHIAAERGNAEVIKLLIREFNVDLSAADFKGQTPLHIAIQNERAGVAKLLITEFKPDMLAIDFFGDTPIYKIIASRNTELVKLLIAEPGVDLSVKDEHGKTLLHMAVGSRNTEFAKLLIAKPGIDLSVKDKYGKTPLHTAIESKNTEFAKLLIAEPSVDLSVKDMYGRTPLHIAVESLNIELIKLLIAKPGVDLSVKDMLGKNPLHIAVESGNINLVKLLIGKPDVVLLETDEPGIAKTKIDLMVKDNQGQTPLHIAASTGKTDLVWLLIAKFGVQPSVQDESGQTPLHIAAKNGYTKLAKQLLRVFAVDPSITDKQGQTPLHLAAKSGNTELAKLLIEELKELYDPSVKDEQGQTPLHIAAENGKAEIVKLLISELSDPSARDEWGQTPLHKAAINGRTEVVKLLEAEPGVDTKAEDMSGQTPWDVASKTIREDLESLLNW